MSGSCAGGCDPWDGIPLRSGASRTEAGRAMSRVAGHDPHGRATQPAYRCGRSGFRSPGGFGLSALGALPPDDRDTHGNSLPHSHLKTVQFWCHADDPRLPVPIVDLHSSTPSAACAAVGRCRRHCRLRRRVPDLAAKLHLKPHSRIHTSLPPRDGEHHMDTNVLLEESRPKCARLDAVRNPG